MGLTEARNPVTNAILKIDQFLCSLLVGVNSLLIDHMQINRFTEFTVAYKQVQYIRRKYSHSPLDNVAKNVSSTIATINTRRLISMVLQF